MNNWKLNEIISNWHENRLLTQSYKSLNFSTFEIELLILGPQTLLDERSTQLCSIELIVAAVVWKNVLNFCMNKHLCNSESMWDVIESELTQWKTNGFNSKICIVFEHFICMHPWLGLVCFRCSWVRCLFHWLQEFLMKDNNNTNNNISIGIEIEYHPLLQIYFRRLSKCFTCYMHAYETCKIALILLFEICLCYCNGKDNGNTKAKGWE